MSSLPLPPGTHYMKGGFRAQVDDLYHKYEQPVMLLVGIAMVLVIVFLEKVPIEIRKQADSLLGRAFLILFTVIVTILYGWPMGILAGLMSALLIGAGGIHPITKPVTEGFSSEMNVRIVPGKHKWFVEKVMGENPLLIEDDTVTTSAVQDLTERGSGNVQSSSVSY
jgi:energy-coupling factor transporter transmembrane protein EcfT